MDTVARKQTQFLGRKLFELLKIFATVKDREYGKLGELRKQVSALMQATFETFSVQLLQMVLIGLDLSFVCQQKDQFS